MITEPLKENPYLGKDGHDYQTIDALKQANREYAERMYGKKENPWKCIEKLDYKLV
jgi:hypothetical protein